MALSGLGKRSEQHVLPRRGKSDSKGSHCVFGLQKYGAIPLGGFKLPRLGLFVMEAIENLSGWVESSLEVGFSFCP